MRRGYIQTCLVLVVGLFGCAPKGGWVDLPLERLPNALIVRIWYSTGAEDYKERIVVSGQPLYDAIRDMLTTEQHDWAFADPRITYAIEPTMLIEAGRLQIECGGGKWKNTFLSMNVDKSSSLYSSAPDFVKRAGDIWSEADVAKAKTTYENHLAQLAHDHPYAGHEALRNLDGYYNEHLRASPSDVKSILLVKKMTCDKVVATARALVLGGR